MPKLKSDTLIDRLLEVYALMPPEDRQSAVMALRGFDTAWRAAKRAAKKEDPPKDDPPKGDA